MNARIYNRYQYVNIQSPVVPEPEPFIPPIENPPGVGHAMTKEERKHDLYTAALSLGIPAKRTWGEQKLLKAINDNS